MEDYKILLLKSEDIDRVWPGIEPLIQKGLDTMTIGGTRVYKNT